VRSEAVVNALRRLAVALALLLAPATSHAEDKAAPVAPAPSAAPGSAPAAVLPGPGRCDATDLLMGLVPFEHENASGDLKQVTDAQIGSEGAAWDSALAVTFMGTGSLTYDLGQVVSISAILLQGDANDTYGVSGSLDGGPASFRPIAEVPNAFARGHGLRTRALQLEPARARYLRVTTGVGDGAFSISELAVFCQAPDPFPPKMRMGGSPPPVETKTAPPASPDAEDSSGGGTTLYALAAALMLLGITRYGSFARAEKRREPAKNDDEDDDEDDEPVREAPRAAAPDARAARSRAEARAELGIRLMFLASGCAALTYEVIWMHLMRLVIGASSMSVGIVLASFMGGMFLGSLFFARYVPRVRHPLRVYAAIEVGIGVFGLLMPLLLPAIRHVYVGLVGYGAVGIALRAVVAAVLLLPPTALMGATLPAVARRYSGGRRGTSALAWLYAANTVGAVLGALLAAFYLLAVWDVWVATFVAVFLNFAVAAYAHYLARSEPANLKGAGSGPVVTKPAQAFDARIVYLGTALSGLTALGAQVVWTRLLTLLFGATVFAFAIILAVFLGGLGIGSAVAAGLLRRGVSPLRGLAWTQLLLVPTVLLSAFVLARVLPYASPSASTPVQALHGLHVLRTIDVILPSAVLWGMSFPLALAAVNQAGGDPGRTSGLVYASNTVGAIAGALLVSFFAIPAYGTKWAEQSLVVLAGLSAAILFYGARGRRDAPRSGFEIPPAWALAAGLIAAALLPGLSKVFLAHGRYLWWVDPRDRYPYVSEGASSTVAVHVAPDGYKNFHVSGRVEATNNPNDLRTERLIGHLTGLMHPHPKSVLVVGLGAGVSAGALTLYPEVKRIVICEIEPRVVGAAQLFTAENYSVLTDPRVEIVFDDARHFLATTREKFDVITSDPIHPWVRGNSILFSREYYEIVRARLEPGGIATQWVPLYETSELAIQIQMRTFTDAFPNGAVFNTAITGRGYDVVLVGGTAPLRFDLDVIDARIGNNARLHESLREVRITNAVDLLATYGTSGPDMKKWLDGVPVNRDFSLKLEYISGLALNAGEADPIYEHMVAGRTLPPFTGSERAVEELRRRLGAKRVR
jgi:spermidine synthase